MIASGFRVALNLNTYPLSNVIRPQCAERAKRGRGKPVLIMHIGFFACFHAISLERSRFSKITTLVFMPLYIALKLLVSLISRLVACSPRIVIDKQTDRQTDRQTYRTTTVTLAAHARRGLIRAKVQCHNDVAQQGEKENINWGSRERAPTSGVYSRAVPMSRYIIEASVREPLHC